MEQKISQKRFVGFGYELKDENGNIIGFERSKSERIFKYNSLLAVADEKTICYIPEDIFPKGVDVVSNDFIRDRESENIFTISAMREAIKKYVVKQNQDLVPMLLAYIDADTILNYCVEIVFEHLSGCPFEKYIDVFDWQKKLYELLDRYRFSPVEKR